MIWWILLIVVGAIWWADRRMRRTWPAPECADELHWVTAADGVRIGVWRHRPRADGGYPVLMVHGLSANHRNFDLDGKHGLAQYLAQHGFDCWLVDLRGRGASDVPQSWCFDDYAQRDLPAVIDHVLSITGYDRLLWVGHSMGGMLLYAVAGAGGYDDRIAAGVTLGSPVRFFHPRWFERGALRLRLHLQRLRLPMPFLVRWFTVLLPLVPRRLLFYQFNPDNVDRPTLRRGAASAIVAVGARVLLQFADWIVHHRWVSEDGSVDYRAGIARITAPLLVVAGAADRLCPAYMVKPAYKEAASAEKRFVEAGVAEGFLLDYGHIDLVFGRYADEEVFPLIHGWLSRFAARCRTEAPAHADAS